jgi:hypothetical protein
MQTGDDWAQSIKRDGNYFRLSRYMIDNEVAEPNLKIKLERALKMSAHIREGVRSESIDTIDPPSLIASPIEIAGFCGITVEQLERYYVCLNRKHSLEYLINRGFRLTPREFNEASKRAAYRAKFHKGPGTERGWRDPSSVKNGAFVFTYGEIQFLTESYFTINWD